MIGTFYLSDSLIGKNASADLTGDLSVDLSVTHDVVLLHSEKFTDQ
jgi:hypothetical protein